MSIRWRYAATFLVGLLAGAIATVVVLGAHWNRHFGNWYVLEVGEQAEVAEEILAGRGQELAERIQESLPDYARALQIEFDDAVGRDWALWRISDVYAQAGTRPPAELQALFDQLPDRASCKVPVAGDAEGDGARSQDR